MRVRTLALLAATALFACGGPGEPEALATFERFRASLRAEDFGAVYDVLSRDDRRRMDVRLESMRGEMARLDADPALATKYRRMAEALGLTVEELRAIGPRELFVRSTAHRSKDTDELRRWAEAELDGPPQIEGDRCDVVVGLPGGLRARLRLIREGGAWRVVLRGV